MNANGAHPQYRQQQQVQGQRDKKSHGVDLPVNNGISHGPMQTHIQVAKPFVFHQTIEGCLDDLCVAVTRDEQYRIAGVRWIDDVRKALKLPVRTFDTAVMYYHKFRLSHADNEYDFTTAAAAALFAACKIEDTLKKSRDILCAAHNVKVSSRADHLTPDDPIFEQPSKIMIGIERLMLEASSFDFRTRHPQQLIIKLARHHRLGSHSAVTKTAHLISLDLYKTYAPLKQCTAVLAFACLELAVRLHAQEVEAIADGRDYRRWDIDRPMVMETLLDLLELYTNHRNSTTVGPEYALDAFTEIRISLNEEQSTRRLPRYTEYIDPEQLSKKSDHTRHAVGVTNGVTPKASRNQMPMPMPMPSLAQRTSPTSPATPSSQPGIRQKAGERGREGTVRFMLNPDRERQEKATVAEYGPSVAAVRR